MKTLNKFDISSFIAPMKANYDTHLQHNVTQWHSTGFPKVTLLFRRKTVTVQQLQCVLLPGGLQKSFVSYTLPRYFVKIRSQNVKLHATILDFLPFSRFLITLHRLGKQISPSSKHVFPSSCSFWYHRLINLSEKSNKQMLKK